MKKKEKRQQQLVDILRKHSGCTIHQMAKFLDYSEMTIRRDVEELVAKKQIEFIGGALVLRKNRNSLYDVEDEILAFQEEKRKIANYAASLVKNSDTVMCDIGSTVSFVADAIASSFNGTIITSSYPVISKCVGRPSTLIAGGGLYHKETGMFDSDDYKRTLSMKKADIAFISASAIHPVHGAMCINEYEVAYKKIMLENSVYKVLLVDSSKWNKISTNWFADLSVFDEIVMDKNEMIEELETYENVKLI